MKTYCFDVVLYELTLHYMQCLAQNLSFFFSAKNIRSILFGEVFLANWKMSQKSFTRIDRWEPPIYEGLHLTLPCRTIVSYVSLPLPCVLTEEESYNNESG